MTIAEFHIVSFQAIKDNYIQEQMINNRVNQREKRSGSGYKAPNKSLASTLASQSSTTDRRMIKKSVQHRHNSSKTPQKLIIPIPRIEKKKFNLSQTLQKQRQRQLIQLKKSVALLRYYNCLMMLFMMLYTTSQTTLSNLFHTKGANSPEIGVKFIDILLKLYTTYKKKESDQRHKQLARNVLKIASTPNEFQRKAEFISRKVTLNFQKRIQIQNASTNTQVSSFWSKILDRLFSIRQQQFAEGMFDSSAEYLCVKDFQTLINNYLSSSRFEKEWRESQLINCQNSIVSHHFTVQFILIQHLCSEENISAIPQVKEMEQRKKKSKTSCMIY